MASWRSPANTIPDAIGNRSKMFTPSHHTRSYVSAVEWKMAANMQTQFSDGVLLKSSRAAVFGLALSFLELTQSEPPLKSYICASKHSPRQHCWLSVVAMNYVLQWDMSAWGQQRIIMHFMKKKKKKKKRCVVRCSELAVKSVSIPLLLLMATISVYFEQFLSLSLSLSLAKGIFGMH